MKNTAGARPPKDSKKKSSVTADMGQFASELNREALKRSWSLKEILFGFLGLAVTIALCVFAIIYREELTDTGFVARYGLLGIMIIAFFFGGAFSAIPVPVPYWMLNFTLPSMLAENYGILSPVWVGLFTAAGATLGQSITFAIGYGGRGLSQRLSSRFSLQFYDKAAGWVKRYGSWTVFIMSVTANPLHLPMTLAIASLRFPVYKFLFFGFIGQLIKSMVLAFSGYYSLNLLFEMENFSSTLFITLLVIAGIIVILGLWQLIVWLIEIHDKTHKYRAALDCARNSGKPFLVGNPWGVKPFRRFFNKPAHGSGDICLDIDRQALMGQPGAVVGTITHLPFADKTFGAAFFSHVLEHLPTADAAKQALEEMKRVADSVFIAYPSKQSIAGWIVRDHHLWVWQDKKCTYVQQRGKKANREKIVVETAPKTT
jgi:membrane protein DedA with SNARE-associated domain